MNQNTVVKVVNGKGRGVFATRDFKKGEVVLRNEVVLYRGQSYKERPPVLPDGSSTINAFTMFWSQRWDSIALGHINLMNHCKHPNTRLSNKYKQKCKVAYAIKNIKKGDELTFEYQCSIPLWFKVK